MLLAQMENFSSSLFPSLPPDDSFQLNIAYDDGLFGRKRKKKPSLGVKDCQLDSPCHSPEMIISALIDEGGKQHPKLFHSDSFTVDGSGTFSPVDMEGFYEIDMTDRCYGGSMTAREDIMLSSSAKENGTALKDAETERSLPAVTADDVDSVSPCTSSASESRLQSEFERSVDDLLANSRWENKELELSMPAHDLLTDFSYLLSDIPSHPDLSCEANEAIDSLLNFCNEKDSCTVNTVHVSESRLTSTDKSLSSAKCREDASQHTASDFESLCANTLSDVESCMNDYSRPLSCGCRGRDCLCIKYDSCSAEEEDVSVEYILSHRPSRARKVKRRRPANGVRRGPGRPRKYENTESIRNTEFVRRGRGRPRKKSVSDAVVWYQSRRKRTVSFTSGYKSRTRQKSTSDDRAVQSVTGHVSPSGADGLLQHRRSRRRDSETQLLSSTSTETDEEDIVDVESIGDEFQELYGVSTMAELVQHIHVMHSYHTQRFVFRPSASSDCSSPRKSTSKFSINLPMPAKGASSHWSDTVLSDRRRRRPSLEQRSKREALNDLERRRRYALARELSALRGVVPEMREGFRAAKVVILAAAENHIRLLERKLRRDQSVLRAERERNESLKAKLHALAVNTCK